MLQDTDMVVEGDIELEVHLDTLVHCIEDNEKIDKEQRVRRTGNLGGR